jgi:hypothetical protein
MQTLIDTLVTIFQVMTVLGFLAYGMLTSRVLRTAGGFEEQYAVMRGFALTLPSWAVAHAMAFLVLPHSEQILHWAVRWTADLIP